VEPPLQQTIALHVDPDRRAEWLAKIGIVLEEADESVFWLEMLSDCEIVAPQKLEMLLAEEHELTALFTASRSTARAR